MSKRQIDLGKKMLLYGDDKFIKDFSAFFYDLNICGAIGKDIKLESLKPDEDSVVVICSFETKKYENELRAHSFTYGKNYYYGTDVIKTIDHYVTGKKTIVFGTGEASKVFSDLYNEIEIAYFIDNNPNKIGATFLGKKTKHPDALRDEKPGEFFVIIIVSALYGVKMQLEEMGLVPKKDFTYFNYGVGPRSPMYKHRLSTMLEMIIKADPLTNRMCGWAFNRMDVYKDGGFNSCCFSGIEITGNIIMDSYDEWLSSVYLRLLRLSVLNGTFVFCNKERCGIIRGDSYDLFPLIDDPKKASIKNNPENDLFLAVGHDSRCNLACKCCKKELTLTLTECESKTLDYMHEKIIKDLLPHCETFHVSGYGDPFYNECYRELMLDKCPAKKILIQTNGLLFNERDWKMIKKKYSFIRLYVSVDAATAKTYKYLRGGSFEKLLKNLRLMSEYKKKGEVDDFRICYVVQAYNFREMKDFVKLGIELGVDYVVFQPILPNGIQIGKKYDEVNIYSPNHPDNKEFKEMLKDPIFDNKIVFPYFK